MTPYRTESVHFLVLLNSATERNSYALNRNPKFYDIGILDHLQHFRQLACKACDPKGGTGILQTKRILWRPE